MDAWMHSRGCSFFLPVIPLVGNSEPESEQKKGQQDAGGMLCYLCFLPTGVQQHLCCDKMMTRNGSQETNNPSSSSPVPASPLVFQVSISQTLNRVHINWNIDVE